MRASTPAWLAERLETRRRYAKVSQCAKCGSDVLSGPSDDDVYWTARVDPEPADVWSEVMARCRGRMSYDLIGDVASGYRLASRDVQHMRCPGRYPVLLDHECEG